ncbi:MAG: hypothetical protein WCI26_06640 [Acidimicrobiales bacterium]
MPSNTESVSHRPPDLAQGISPSSSRNRRSGRAKVLVALVFLAVPTAACGGGSTSTPVAPTGANPIRPPDIPLQGCTYAPNGSIPPGAAQGIDPHIPAFSPTTAATSALGKIRARGGTGLVYGYSLPAGTELFAGPDTSTTPVKTVTRGRTINVSDPVLWTSASKARWMVFFLACGGTSPYWVSVSQVTKADKAAGAQMTRTIGELLAAAPYTTTGKASALPITIDAQRHLVWVDPKVSFAVGRGQLVGY